MTLLEIYDILGCKVTTLLEEKLVPGSYEIEWNAKDVPTGVYFYEVTSGIFKEVKKMLLIK